MYKVNHSQPLTTPSHSLEKLVGDQDVKTSSVAKRVLQSHLFWAMLGICVLTVTLAVALTRFPNIPFGVIGGTAGIAMLLPAITHPKRFAYEVSLGSRAIRNSVNPERNPWANPIIPGKLSLGGLPLKNKDHHVTLPYGAQSVLSLIEEFEEKTPSLLGDPVSTEDWQKKSHIHHKRINTPDFKPLSLEKINKAIKFIHQEIQSRRHIYVHCKAGVGRSALTVICYLLKYGKEHGIELNSVEEAIEYVRERRPIINMSKKQVEIIHIFYNNLLI